VLNTVHSQDNVRLVQHQQPATARASAQDVEVTASAIDFLDWWPKAQRALTSGPAPDCSAADPDTGGRRW